MNDESSSNVLQNVKYKQCIHKMSSYVLVQKNVIMHCTKVYIQYAITVQHTYIQTCIIINTATQKTSQVTFYSSQVL